MKPHLNNKYVKWGVTAFCVLAAAIVFYYMMFHSANIKLAFKSLGKVLSPILIGMVLAYVITPAMNWIEKTIVQPIVSKISLLKNRNQKKIIRGTSILLTTLFCFTIIYALIAMFASQIIPSISNLVNNFDTYIANVTNLTAKVWENNPMLGEYLNKALNHYSIVLENWLNDTVLNASSEIIKSVSLGVINILGVLWNIVIGFIVSIYLMASKETFAGQAKKLVYAVLDQESANQIINDFRFTNKTFIGFFTGKILDSIIIGLLCFIGTTILNTPYAALVSVIIGITNIIPFFGPALGAVPSVILVLLVDPMHPLNAIYLLIFILILQQIDGNIIGPKILGESTGLTSFWVIFAITVFGGAFGVPGMIVGVPIFAVIFSGVRALVNQALLKKSLPIESESYIYLEKVDDAGLHQFEPEIKKESIKREKKKK